MKVSIVIPVYNEVHTIETVLARVQYAHPYEKEIIVVDDCSTDGTREKLESLKTRLQNIKIIHHEKNKGKGASLRTGFQAAAGEIIIIQDADLEYDPKEYSTLLEPILDGRADVVYGSRFLGGPHRVLFFWHFVGNQFLTLLSNIFSNLNLSDMETGYKVFKKKVVDGMKLRSDRFGFEPEFTIKAAKKGWKIYEVPVSYSGRTYEEGKKITWKDGFKAMFSILYFSFFD